MTPPLLLRDASEVGSCVRRQGGLLAEKFVHDGNLGVPLLHLLRGGPGHVVLKLERAGEGVRAAGTPFLQEREGRGEQGHEGETGKRPFSDKKAE